MLNIRKKYRKCVICKNIIDAYEPISLFFRKMQEQYDYFPGPPETCNTKEYLCPICHSSDRDRLCIAFMEKLLKKKGKNLKLLHIAPAKPINEAIQMRFSNILVKNMDLYMEDMDYILDIQDMKDIPDNEFDLWICFHVLEHVQDDIRAMKELKRILVRGGRNFISSP